LYFFKDYIQRYLYLLEDKTSGEVASQLYLYASGLSFRTSIPLKEEKQPPSVSRVTTKFWKCLLNDCFLVRSLKTINCHWYPSSSVDIWGNSSKKKSSSFDDDFDW